MIKLKKYVSRRVDPAMIPPFFLHFPSFLASPFQSAGVRQPISYEDLDISFGASSRVTSSDDRVAAAKSTPAIIASRAASVATKPAPIALTSETQFGADSRTKPTGTCQTIGDLIRHCIAHL